MVLLRQLLGDVLRRLRLRQGRTLREVSASARVSLGYLSEVERGQKEASSELLAAICSALGTPLSQVFREVSDNFALAELQSEPVFSGVREPALDGPVRPAGAAAERLTARPAAAQHGTGPARSGLPASTGQRLVVPAAERISMRDGQHLVSTAEPVLDAALPLAEPAFDQVKRTVHDITNMVPV
jgi:transcriptional regulator with XRE-family HTH domain